MACAVEEDFSNFESCARSACASEASCSAADWEGDACSKPCAPSRSSWEAHFSMTACSSFCGPAFPGPAFASKISWADYVEDDRSTLAGDEETRSFCDEEAEDDLADNDQSTRHARVDWADLVDSEGENEAWPSVDAEGELATSAGPPARWADLESSEQSSEGCAPPAAPEPPAEEKEAPEPRPARSSRSSRRARARAATAPAPAPAREGGEEAAGGQAASGKRSHSSWTQAKVDKDAWAGHGDERRGAGKGASKGKGAGKGASRGTSKGGKGGGKAAGKGAAAGTGKGGGKGASEKYQCQLLLGIEEDSKFRVVRRLIGSGGENMKNINRETGAKLRLRGRGSKFLEGEEQEEAPCELMLCISAQERAGYEAAKATASELIEGIHRSYRAFCHKAGKPCPELEFDIHEGYRAGSR